MLRLLGREDEKQRHTAARNALHAGGGSVACGDQHRNWSMPCCARATRQCKKMWEMYRLVPYLPPGD
jgi:hypothetical protein